MDNDITTVLETKSISKSFGSISANRNINFKLKKGEIHAILGENGAGKSTLMNIISGLYQSDKGDILIHGEKVKIRSSIDAVHCGIHMVHQNFMLIPVFTVLENIILGCEPLKVISIDIRKAKYMIKNLMKELGLSIDQNTLVENLPVGLQQRVEIMKGLYKNAKILLLDEPTSMLTPQEIEEFFAMLNGLSKKGVSIVFITHKIKEALKISDRITVMRQGKIIESIKSNQTNEKRLAELMVGRIISQGIETHHSSTDKIILEIKNLVVFDKRETEAVRGVSFKVHEGEIVAIAGVQGNGQSELAEALSGLRDIKSGSIYLNGKKMIPNNPRMLYEQGFGHIPENRLTHGLIDSYTIAENQVLSSYYKHPFAGKVKRNIPTILDHSKILIHKFNINAPGPETLVKNLSGGNQQKVVLSRELNRNICFLLANHPTRGLDVSSILFFHSQFLELKNKGAAVLLISSDIDEIFSLADRIAVMFEGRFKIVTHADKISRSDIGLYMSGVKTSLKKEAENHIC